VIFGVAVVAAVAPLPNTYDMLQIYVSRLKAVIGISSLLVLQRNTSNCASQKLQYHLDRFLLWVLVIGGIASLDKPERAWFVEQLEIVKEVLQVDWYVVTRITDRFLWLDNACGESGEELWAEVENLRNARDEVAVLIHLRGGISFDSLVSIPGYCEC
jgi:hypothetical protein